MYPKAVGITVKQFEMLQSRRTAPNRKASPVQETIRPSAPLRDTAIVGIDPSLRGTGFGVIRLASPHPIALEHGTIRCPALWERSRCLAQIMAALRQVLQKHRPTICVIEGLFYAQNFQTALTMGEARGAALATVAEAGLEIYEIEPRKMKQAIVGYGAAQKSAVSKMVQRMLHLQEEPLPDAADALALALAHAMRGSGHGLKHLKRV